MRVSQASDSTVLLGTRGSLAVVFPQPVVLRVGGGMCRGVPVAGGAGVEECRTGSRVCWSRYMWGKGAAGSVCRRANYSGIFIK